MIFCIVDIVNIWGKNIEYEQYEPVNQFSNKIFLKHSYIDPYLHTICHEFNEIIEGIFLRHLFHNQVDKVSEFSFVDATVLKLVLFLEQFFC